MRRVGKVAPLPLFLENTHSSAMILRGINFVNDVIQHVNPSQTPVITMDQPLFALYRLIQWNLPESHDEDKYVVTFGGLQVDRWVNALVDADCSNSWDSRIILEGKSSG